MDDLTGLEVGDALHITLDGGKTIPLDVGGTDKRKVWLHYEGQEYAILSETDVTNDEFDHQIMTLYSGDDEIVNVEDIEVV